jgi:predicted nucleic acid-binding protein
MSGIFLETEETHARAVHLASQHKLSFYDAHILAAAVSSGAHTLMSEDMHAGWVVQGIEIRNPFSG